MTITTLQLVQMVVGCGINYLAFSFKESGGMLMMSLLLLGDIFVVHFGDDPIGVNA